VDRESLEENEDKAVKSLFPCCLARPGIGHKPGCRHYGIEVERPEDPDGQYRKKEGKGAKPS